MAELFQLVFILWCSRIFTNAQSSKVTKTIVTSSMNVSTPTSLPPSEDLKKSNIGLIIAVSFGAAGLIVLIILAFLLCYKRRRQFLDEAQNPPELGRDAGHSDNMVKKIITMDGGVLEIADIKLSIGPECLANDTEVTVIKDDQNFAFQSLINMNLIEDTPTIVKFFPDGLKFLNPANLTVKLKKIVPNSKLHVLHGFRDPYSKRMVWELVINDIDVNESEGFVNIKIEGFSLYSFIVATCGFVGRLLSHLNQSFACCAYALYRRQPLTGLIDISVVFVSDFVENTHGENIKQLQDHLKEDYVKGGKGMMKRIDTSRSLEMSLNFPHHKSDSYEFRINPSELDKYGFVVDKFTGTEIEYPAAGNVVILEEYDSSWSELWKLKVREGGRGIAQQPSSKNGSGILNVDEISAMSTILGEDWNGLGALMNIPFTKREEIRLNHQKYPGAIEKAWAMLMVINQDENSRRQMLEKCLEEINRGDLLKEMHFRSENKNKVPPKIAPQSEARLENKILNPRELFRLSGAILRDWYRLAALMKIDQSEMDEVNTSHFYRDHRSKAEKILSLINRQIVFSRTNLTDGLKKIERLDLVEIVKKGIWRHL